MARRVDISAPAASDIKAVRLWLGQRGAGPAALLRLRNMRDAIKDLRHRPCTWPRSVREQGLRERHVEGHVLVYEVEPDTGDNLTAGDVVVLRLFGPWQDR